MPVHTKVALLRQVPGTFETAEVDLQDPVQGEITVKLAAAGLCHSDDHLATGDLPIALTPYVGGHEGAGVVTAVGPHTTGFQEGDHVVFSFLATCGQCEFCARGLSNLCNLGAATMTGSRPGRPGDYRMSEDGVPVGQACGISTFSEYTTVSTMSALKIDQDVPLASAALLGCGVPTGFGSAVNSARVSPGDVVIVMGMGGIGVNAVQGAAHAGARAVVVVDPEARKRALAPTFGATDAFADIAEATDHVRSLTDGQGADATIIAIGVVRAEHITAALASIRKAGTVVVTGLGPMAPTPVQLNLGELTLFQKRIQGSLFGQSNPRFDIPNYLRLYRSGALKLDELVTSTYTLDDVATAYQDMHSGLNLRGVVLFD